MTATRKRAHEASRHRRPDDGNAFVQDPLEMDQPPKPLADDDAACSLAEDLAEEYLESATSNEDIGEIWNDEAPRPDLGEPMQQLGREAATAEPPDFSPEPEEPYRKASHEPARRRPKSDRHHPRRPAGV